MMQLIRIRLDPLNKQTVRGFVNPNIFHAAIEASIRGENSRVLWRIDRIADQSYLLMLTSADIDAQFLIHQFGFKEESAQTVDYEKLLSRITKESKWIFRLTANPTHHAKNDKKEPDGKVLAHVTPQQQMAWLEQKAAKHGFQIELEKTKVIGSTWIQFRKKKSETRVQLKEAVFEGVLSVADPSLFKKALTEGVGRGKAYGMGLLTVIPYHE